MAASATLCRDEPDPMMQLHSQIFRGVGDCGTPLQLQARSVREWQTESVQVFKA